MQAAHLALVRQLLQQVAPRATACVFGSRATGQGLKPFSDLDLLIDADPELTLREWADLREAFSQSDLPWRVDLLDRRTATPGFLRVIEAAGAFPLHEATAVTSETLPS